MLSFPRVRLLVKKANILQISTIRFLSSSNVFPQKFLEGKLALVTGSTSGIGLGFAKSLSSQGCKIMLNGFGIPEEIKKIQNEIEKQYKVPVSYHPADLSKPAQIKDMMSTTISKFGNIHILVNNAGIQHVSPIDQFPDDKWDLIIAVNLSSAFHTTKIAIPIMKKQKWGRIINTASVHGLVASINKSAYVAAKHGISGLTKVTALELAGSGVTCNAICPGWVLTPLVEKQIETRAKEQKISLDDATNSLLSEKQPSKQFATTEQLGQVLLFLCSSGADQITGVSLPVDGGWTSQ